MSGRRSDEIDPERKILLQSGHCCWHCRYYIRPIEGILDGSVNSICTIDRDPLVYPAISEMTPGDKVRKPGESCNCFEMDIPPSLD